MEHATILRTDTVAIESVSSHPMNARRGNTAAIEQSLRNHGQYAPIVVHEPTGHILKGNHTHRVMRDKLGKTHILATFVNCTEEQALAILAVDNKSSDNAGYDDEALLALLEQLNGDDLLIPSGYTESDMDDLVAILDESWRDRDPGTIPDALGDPDPGAVPTDFDPKENLRGIDARKANESDRYDQAHVRSMMLTYPVSQYAVVIDQLARLAKVLDLNDNASVVELVVRKAYEEIDD